MTVEDLIVIGAGGASREIAWVVEEINASESRWNLLGFLDDDTEKQGKLVDGYPVLGPVQAASDYAAARLIVGVASYKNRGVRRRIVERLSVPRDRFATIVAPTAHVSKHASIGRGCALLHRVVVAHNTEIGDHSLISSACVIGHDARFAGYVTLAQNATVSGSTRLEADVYIGGGATIRDGVTVGEGSLVGLGAVVFRDVAKGDTVVGNPAKSLRARRHENE
ncbi:MAG: acetyltransferase [Bryobacterales bacterium]|nr:acetyltransferase [Bryobacterales bacterium]